jgi:hypothetical protein
MIKFRLICNDCKISFDSWFLSSKKFDKLKKQNHLNCHNCNSLKVEKTLMSPNIFRSKNNIRIDNKNEKYKKIEKKVLEYQNFIKENLDYVGENFAYEARSIHYKNKKVSKGIYGTATEKDLKELNEEGIETETIPWVKNTTN